MTLRGRLIPVFCALLSLLALTCPAVEEGAKGVDTEIGLKGSRMVSNGRARAFAGGAAMRSEGEVPVGRLTARRSDLANQNDEEKVLGLRDLNVNVCIEGLTARTTITHVFLNETDALLEGCFTFALPSGVAVDRFAMTIQSESDLMEGSLVDHGQAKSIYRDLVYGQSVDPGTLEWVSANRFRATIFPIPARGTKTIVISYLQGLTQNIVSRETREITYRYPLALRGEGANAIPAATTVRLHAIVPNLSAEGTVVSTPDAKVNAAAWGGTTVDVEFKDKETLAPDWCIAVRTPISEPPKDLECLVQAHRDGETQPGYFAVTLTPEIAPPSIPEALDVLFVVDTSASRTQVNHFAAVALIESVLKALSGHDRFGILAFDVVPQPLPGGWRLAAPENVQEAVEFLRAIRPMGATDISAAFETAAQLYGKDARPHGAVVYIGDAHATYGKRGREGLEQTVTASLKSLNAEMFSVWQGSGVKSSFGGDESTQIRKMAALSGGPILHFTADMNPAHTGWMLAGQLGQPALRHAQLSMHSESGEPLSLNPEFLGGLPLNFSTTLYGAYARPGAATVRLTGQVQGKPYEREWKVNLPAHERSNASVEHLYARARMGELLNSGSTKEATALGLQHRVLCPGTAFLVLESEQMYQNYRIKRGNGNGLDAATLRSKFLAAAPLVRAARTTALAGKNQEEAQDQPPAGPRMNFDRAPARANTRLEIGKTIVDVSLQKAEIPSRQGRLALARGQLGERRWALSRLIAAERGLVFEPETVFSRLWLEALPESQSDLVGLERTLGVEADQRVWEIVSLQPFEAPERWLPGGTAGMAGATVVVANNSYAESTRLIDLLMNPVRPSVVRLSDDETELHLDSHTLAQQFVSTLLLGRPAGLVKGGGESVVTRAIVSRLVKSYSLKDVPPARLATIWNFLAQLSLVEGQHKAAEPMAERALKVSSASVPEHPARLARLILGLAQQIRCDLAKASDSYRMMLEGHKPLTDEGRHLTYYAAVTTMAMSGNRKGVIAVLEKWYLDEIGKSEVTDNLGRALLSDGQKHEAIRAFSSAVEFFPLLAEKYDSPEAFLGRK